MDEFWIVDSADFRTLWERICSPKEKEAEPDDLALFQKMIQESGNTAAFCAQLARSCSARAKQTLAAHSRELYAQCRNLRLEYFIRSGISYRPEAACPLLSGKAMSLRSIMLKNQAMAEQYRRMADISCDSVMKSILCSFAEQCERHAVETRELLAECFS